jgi:predicted alpha/beta-hydrolase family hydrolase
VKHLETLTTSALIVQGTRDTFGRPEEVERYKLSRKIKIEWIEDGDHSLKPRASSGRTEAQNLAVAIATISEFVNHVMD